MHTNEHSNCILLLLVFSMSLALSCTPPTPIFCHVSTKSRSFCIFYFLLAYLFTYLLTYLLTYLHVSRDWPGFGELYRQSRHFQNVTTGSTRSFMSTTRLLWTSCNLSNAVPMPYRPLRWTDKIVNA